MKKILCWGISSNIGGTEKYLLENLKKLNKNEYKFDFIVSEINEELKQEIIDLGSKVHVFKGVNSRKLKERKKVEKYLTNLKNNYDIFYANIQTFSFITPIKLAKKVGYYVVTHIHSSGQSKLVTKILNNLNRKKAIANSDKLLACSKNAGAKAFLNNEFTIIPNPVNYETFKFSEITRSNVRKALFLDDKLVIGHVGTFNKIKNQMYLLEVLDKVVKKEKNTILLLIGSGFFRKKVENKVKKMNLHEHVVFVDNQLNIHDYYNAMDIFLFPSKFEGLGMVSLEAQANGLPVIQSINVPEETKVNSNVIFLDINKKNISDWSMKTLSLSRGRVHSNNIPSSPFEVNNSHQIFTNIFRNRG